MECRRKNSRFQPKFSHPQLVRNCAPRRSECVLFGKRLQSVTRDHQFLVGRHDIDGDAAFLRRDDGSAFAIGFGIELYAEPAESLRYSTRRSSASPGMWSRAWKTARRAGGGLSPNGAGRLSLAVRSRGADFARRSPRFESRDRLLHRAEHARGPQLFRQFGAPDVGTRQPDRRGGSLGGGHRSRVTQIGPGIQVLSVPVSAGSNYLYWPSPTILPWLRPHPSRPNRARPGRRPPRLRRYPGRRHGHRPRPGCSSPSF